MSETGAVQIEKTIQNYIASDAFQKVQVDARCHAKPKYRVYLIDNFEPACRDRGIIGGTSVIPPNKLKELLPPKPASGS